jgi:hypothetical protein
MKLFRVICGSSLAGACLLLLVGCGSPASSTDAGSASPLSDAGSASPLSTAGPSVEGTGLEPPQNPSKDARSVSLPSLPTGNANSVRGSSGRRGCFDASFLPRNPPVIPSGMVVSVTGVMVTGPFTVISPASCVQSSSKPACAGLQLTTNNSGEECVFAVLLKGTGEVPLNQDVKGSVSLQGGLSCPGASTTACQRYARSLQIDARATGPAPFTFEPSSPPTTGSSPPPTTGSSPPPTTGSSPPPTTGSSPPPTTGSSPPPTTGSSPPPTTGSP